MVFIWSVMSLLPAGLMAEEEVVYTTPSGLFPSAGQRALWAPLIESQREGWIAKAEEQLAEAWPEWSDETYLDYSRTGERTAFGKLKTARDRRLYRLFLGELAEGKGRFLGELEKVIESLVSEPTWVLPPHDGELRSFKGEIDQIDLGSAMRSFDLAMVVDIFAEEMKPELVAEVHEAIRRRTLEPYLEAVRTGEVPEWLWWMKTTNNWNAVCHFGVIGSGLIMERDLNVREALLSGMQLYLPNYLKGFTEDGYCSEGLGYWNYGFAQYAALAELVRRSTEGRIDLLKAPKIESIALYPFRLQMGEGTYPVFSDAGMGGQPSDWLTGYLSRRFESLEPYVKDADKAIVNGGHISLLCFGFSQRATQITDEPKNELEPMHSIFPDGGVVVSRAGKAGVRTSLALKAGHNGEHHNHNDVGSFVVAVDGVSLIVDPGKEIYRKRTFGPNRYESKVLNSFGHSVPVVGGALQPAGKEYRGAILETAFSEAEDRVLVDMSKAYAVEGLEALTREWVHLRAGKGMIVVTDRVKFSKGTGYAEALITYGEFKETGPGRGEIEQDGVGLELRWSVSEGEVTVRTELIEERLPGGRIPLRIAFSLREPVREAVFTFGIRPL